MQPAFLMNAEKIGLASMRFITFLILILISLSFFPSILRAELASGTNMDDVSKNWLTYIVSQKGAWAGSTTPSISGSKDIIENDTLLGRCYFVSPRGYVIIPVLKEMPPVMAYSDETPIDIDEPEGFARLLHQVLQDRVRTFVTVYGSLDQPQSVAQPLFSPVNKQTWDKYAIDPKDYAQNASKDQTAPLDAVGPLLTTTWHQGAPYNNLCPTGDGGKCVVGCVATAAAQIVWFHQWPNFGQGTHTYYWTGDNSCGGSSPGQNLSVNYAHPYSYVNNSTNVAQLSYEMGVAFNMMYGRCASGAYLDDAPAVFTDLFRYDPSIDIRHRTSYMPITWFTMVKTEINQGHPILYGIYSHAIVCDGWQEAGTLQQYHFNYGWGGSQNAWYTLDQLYCPWSGCGLDYEMMIRHIIPLTGLPWMGSNQFSDTQYGDNDGVPEGGEKIVLSLKIANYGAAPITNVSATLAIDDNSLVITKNSSTFGDIPGRDSVSNAADPFEFQIPADYAPRTDSFIIYVTWNGTNVDTMVIEKAIGSSGILLVDDDENDNVDIFYKKSFDDLRIPYDVWVKAASQTPDSIYLSKYPIVIWFTGDNRFAPISSTEVTSMEGYLHHGGKLLLSGQGIAYELGTYNLDFLNNYLKASYQSTGFVPILSAASGGQVLSAIDSMCIQGGGSANNQSSPDHIIPVNGGTAEFAYYGQADFGAVSYSGTYQSLFLSFGAEGITNGDGRWMTRDSVIAKIMAFFGYRMPSSAPSVMTVAVSPGESMHLVNHTPDITWTVSDPAALPQLKYQVQVDNDSDWTSISSWDSGILDGADTHIGYAGSELVDGATYYIRVRVYDGIFWSGWRYSHIRLNSVVEPTAPTPTGMQAAAAASPSLMVTNPTDREFDALTYSFEVYADSGMTDLVTSAGGIAAGIYGKTSWLVPVTLSDDHVYFWRARVFDGYEYGPWTERASFWVNSINTPPTPSSLISPVDNSALVGGKGNFHWSQSTDPDLYDQVHYTFYVTADSTFGMNLIVLALDTTGYAITDPLVPGYTYYWKVVTSDQLGASLPSEQIFRFTIGQSGDANGDRSINVGDAVYLINYVFKLGPSPTPLLMGDANCDNKVNVGDAVFLINFVFKGGTSPGCQKK